MPPRLLGSTRNGFERELLSSASTDRAPDGVRARVLLSVAQACSGAPAAVDPLSIHESWSADRRRRRSGRWVWGAGLGIVGLAASVAALVLVQRLPAGNTRPAEHTAAQDTAQAAIAGASALAAAAPPASAAGAESQQALANTSAGALAATGTPLALPAEEGAPDWLGAQLQLLGETRRLLEDGSLEQAESLLEGYDARFPGGVVGPQISALRGELQRRLAERAQPAAERTHTAAEEHPAEPTPP